MGNIQRRVKKLELKTGIGAEQELLLICLIQFGDEYVCPGRNEQIKQAEIERRVFFRKSQKVIVINVAEGCGNDCTRCEKAHNV